MDFEAEELPESCLVECKGNFQTRNARFRAAVCQHFRLQVAHVNGSGNCFFESVVMLLRAADLCPYTLTALELRRNVVHFFRTCIDSQEDICERIQVEIEHELQEELVCSSRVKVNGVRVHGLVPAAIPVYFDAVEQDNVWVQGWHWQRAISILFSVRVAVVIFGQRVVRFIGQGPVTIFLYKVDAETHFDPMLPLAPDQAVQCTLPHVFSSSQERVDKSETAPSHAPMSPRQLLCELVAPRNVKRLERRIDEAPTIIEIKSDSEDGSLPTTLPQEGVHSRAVRACRVKREDVAAAAAPGECPPCTTLGCTLLHFLIQSQCVALPECSAQKRAAAMTMTSLSPPELVAQQPLVSVPPAPH